MTTQGSPLPREVQLWRIKWPLKWPPSQINQHRPLNLHRPPNQPRTLPHKQSSVAMGSSMNQSTYSSSRHTILTQRPASRLHHLKSHLSLMLGPLNRNSPLSQHPVGPPPLSSPLSHNLEICRLHHHPTKKLCLCSLGTMELYLEMRL